MTHNDFAAVIAVSPAIFDRMANAFALYANNVTSLTDDKLAADESALDAFNAAAYQNGAKRKLYSGNYTKAEMARELVKQERARRHALDEAQERDFVAYHGDDSDLQGAR